MTADRTAIASAFALVLAATSWGCSSTGGSNDAVQLPPRQPDLAAPTASPGYGTAPGAAGPFDNAPNTPTAGPYGNPPQAGGYGTAPGVYGSGAPQGTNATGAPGFPQQPATSYPPAAGALASPEATSGQMAQNTGVCNAAAARSVIGQLGTVDASETAKAASGAETVARYLSRPAASSGY